MNIIITGAAGQIGSDISKLLLKSGHQITMIDNLRNGHIENIIENNKLIAPYHNIDIFKDNLFNLSGRYDAIIHLAAVTSLPDCESNKLETININVGGTINIIELAKKLDIPHIIFASTSAVYENTKKLILTEELEINPTLLYSLSKKMAEEVVDSYRKNYNIKITTLRFFNVFGPNGDETRKTPPVLNYIIKELKNNRSPILTGDGEQVRDFIHVSDIIKMLEICLKIKPNDTFNVCTGKTTSINSLAKWVSEALGKTNIPILYKKPAELWDCYPSLFAGKNPLSKDIVEKESKKYCVGSFEKANKLLNWNPDLNIENLVKLSAVQSIK